MKKIIIGLVGLFLVIYLGGLYYFSTHLFPKTSINDISCGKETFSQAMDKLMKKTEDYSISLEREGQESVIISNKDSKVADNPINEKEVKDLQKKYRPIWFVKVFDEYTYSLKDIVINEDAITEFVKGNESLHPKKKVKPVSAKLKYDGETKQYKIINEKVGNQIVDKRLIPDLQKAIERGEDAVVL